jgi:hypothetical protein
VFDLKGKNKVSGGLAWERRCKSLKNYLAKKTPIDGKALVGRKGKFWSCPVTLASGFFSRSVARKFGALAGILER